MKRQWSFIYVYTYITNVENLAFCIFTITIFPKPPVKRPVKYEFLSHIIPVSLLIL